VGGSGWVVVGSKDALALGGSNDTKLRSWLWLWRWLGGSLSSLSFLIFQAKNKAHNFITFYA
jgi:hypothetical protein